MGDFISYKEKRLSNFELLRIVSMLIIIAYHYAVHGKFSFDNITSFNYFWIQFLSLWGKLGVNCFVLITGYFLSNKKDFRWKSIIRFYLQVSLFSILIYVSFLLMGLEEFSVKMAIVNFFPIIYSWWWFPTTYFILNLISPFLNQFIDSVGKQGHLKCLVIILTLWSVIPTFTTATMGGADVIWFVILYLVGAYIAKYPNKFIFSKKINLSIFIICTLFITLFMIFCNLAGTKFEFLQNYSRYFANQNTLLLVMQSFSLFCLFNSYNFGSSVRIINFLSSMMFVVYLFHDNKLVRVVLWENIFRNATFQDSSFLFIHSICTILIVFIVSVLISIFYKLIFDRLINAFTDRIIDIYIKKLKFKFTLFLLFIKKFAYI